MTIADEAGRVRSLTRQSILVDPLLSLFQKILLISDGSVTELLSVYTGKEIRVRKIEQSIWVGGPPAELACAETTLLRRKIMLIDRSVDHVYAESIFIVDRLSPRIQSRLLESDAPIGLLWKEEKSEMYREIIDLRIEQNPDAAAHFGLRAATRLLSRTYVLRQQGRPIGMITEKFPASSFR